MRNRSGRSSCSSPELSEHHNPIESDEAMWAVQVFLDAGARE